MANGSKVPHTLRFITFLLRLVLGVNFFYLGWSAFSDPTLAREFSALSLGSLYTWLSGANDNLRMFFAWALIVIGVCLVLGLLTRIAAFAAIGFLIVSYLPALTSSTLSATVLVNDEAIAILSLLILVFSNAGSYLGIDKFLHIGFSSRKQQ